MNLSISESTSEARPAYKLLSHTDANLWNGPAPTRLRDSYHSLDDAENWHIWQKHLATRQKPRPIKKCFPKGCSPLNWALGDDHDSMDTANLIDQLEQLRKRSRAERIKPKLTTRLESWLWSSDSAVFSVPHIVKSLAWAHALPELSRYLNAQLWWQLLNRLFELVRVGERTNALAEPLANQLLTVELPLVLAYQFPEINPCRNMRALAKTSLAQGIEELLDEQGLPQAQLLPIFRSLVACWSRARAVGGRSIWSVDTEKKYRQLVLETIRLSRADGRQVLVDTASAAWNPQLFRLSLRLTDKASLKTLARCVLPGNKARNRFISLPAATHSESAGLAVLQPTWRRNGTKLTFAYHGKHTHLELQIRGELIFSGIWESHLHCDGKPIELMSDWEEVCWVSDDDVDYVEIEAKASGGLVIQRQVLLPRNDDCLLLCDAIVGVQRAELTYANRLPLSPHMSFEPSAETQEGLLVGKKAKLIVLPLALPEWRIDSRRGNLALEKGKLMLSQSTTAQNFYAPLFLDFKPKRAAKGITWRQLAVAEQRHNQSSEVAVGYRAQVGKRQWLIYRSLSRLGIRTVLGQNLSSEFLFGRLLRDGEVTRLLEIE